MFLTLVIGIGLNQS